MKKFLTIDDFIPEGKVVLLRADLNVPMQDGAVTDDTRITRLVPTLVELSAKGAKTVILSHFGRPKGKDAALSLRPVSKALSERYGQSVRFVDDCIGDSARKGIAEMKDGDVILLENVRFYPEEEKDDKSFAQAIAQLGDVYVNDAFSCAHRAHATTHGIAALLPSYAGRLMEAELNALASALEQPERPVVAIVGGAKISTKLDLLNNLVTKIDVLALGGGMANTFLAAQDNPVGKSLCEREMKDQALMIMDTAKKSKCQVFLPTDAIVATEFKANPPTKTIAVDNVKDNDMMLDIGPETVTELGKLLEGAKTVLWNGPMGAFETEPFDAGTTALAKKVAELTKARKIISVAGGGDTVFALVHAGVEEEMTYVSTAGGAFLEWLEGKTLPGVKVLEERATALRKAS
ncbi:MAG TPA: phosphoglycerate kinase [Patescibacteria group bacterium]|nr:phosphoglycerate kinase [Patescibacteria group bacterium]